MKILKNIGSLIETPSYYGHLTGKENLEIIQTILKVPKSNIDKVLKIVRLESQAEKKVRAYSLGMKQRLGIASAMLAFPKLLILDEPTNGLDPLHTMGEGKSLEEFFLELTKGEESL